MHICNEMMVRLEAITDHLGVKDGGDASMVSGDGHLAVFCVVTELFH